MSSSPQKSPSVETKLAIATKHPGVFMETKELEEETGRTLPIASVSLKKLTEDEVNEMTKVKSELPPEEPMQEDVAEEEHVAEVEATLHEVEVSAAPDKITEEPPESKPEPQPTPEPEASIKPPSTSGEQSDDAEKPSLAPTRRSQRRREKKKPDPDQIELPIEPEQEPLSPFVDLDSISANASECGEEESLASDQRDDNESVASGSTVTTRSSSRRKPGDIVRRQRGKAKKVAVTSTKGKSRRIIFKKSATKAPSAVARVVTSDRIYYKGQFFTKGDIVSVVDIDGGVYYAQLRGFLTDQYCEKSCVITWLLPTTNSPEPEDGFDPATYIVGPEEELPRKLDFFDFVMHAPDDYFYYKNAPYPTMAVETDQEYVLTRAGPKVRLIKEGKAVFKDLKTF